MNVALKRVYDPPSRTDGKRVLVDRLWPRGLSKDEAQVDVWLKEVAPTTELRRWFGHDPQKWREFERRYRAELKHNPAMDELREHVRNGPVTLVYAARDSMHCNAVVLKKLLESQD